MEIWRCKFRCVRWFGRTSQPGYINSCWVCKETWCLALSWWKKALIQLATFPRLLPLIGLLGNSTFLNSLSDFFQKELVKQNSFPISPEIQYTFLQVQTVISYLLYIIVNNTFFIDWSFKKRAVLVASEQSSKNINMAH